MLMYNKNQNITGLEESLTKIKNYLLNYHNDISFQNVFLSGGDAIWELEKKIKEYYKRKYALLVCNVTNSLNLLSIALRIHDTEIITTPLTWGGTLGPFLHYNNKIIFADVEKDTLCLDPDSIRQSITKNVKAVIAVDYLGNPSDSYKISKICKDNDIIFIVDSAQGFGARRNGRPAGYYSDATVISFGKYTSTGIDGGAIITDNEELFTKLLLYSQHPYRQKRDISLNSHNEYTPINCRLNPISAIMINDLLDESLLLLNAYQNKCFEILKTFEKTGLVEIFHMQNRKILPSF